MGRERSPAPSFRACVREDPPVAAASNVGGGWLEDFSSPLCPPGSGGFERQLRVERRRGSGTVSAQTGA
jgi:hypothetical protein